MVKLRPAGSFPPLPPDLSGETYLDNSLFKVTDATGAITAEIGGLVDDASTAPVRIGGLFNSFEGSLYPTDWLNIPLVVGLTWTNNSPGAGSVAWTAFTLSYQGTKYAVVAGNTADKFIWWNKATSTTVLQTGAAAPAIAADQFILALNSSGTALPSLLQNVIYADYISAGAVTADKISVTSLAAIQANIGAATISDKLTLNGASGAIAIGTTPPTSASAGTGIWIDRVGLYGLNANTQEFYIRATDGVAVFGGGNDLLDHTGVTVLTDDGGSNGLTWKYGGATIGFLYAAQAVTHNFVSSLAAQSLTDTVSTVKNVLYANSDAQTTTLLLQANGSAEGTHPGASFATLGVINGLTVGGSTYPAAMLDVRGGGLFTDDVVLANNKAVRIKDSGGTARAIGIIDGSNNFISGPAALASNGTLTLRMPQNLLAFTISTGGLIGLGKNAVTYGVECATDFSLDSGKVYRINGSQIAYSDLAVSDLTLSAKNIVTDTTTGTKFGTATNQKIGFYNVTPIVQPVTGGTEGVFTANSGTAVNDASTFDGYTLKRLVRSLRELGLLS